jgi:hypothetical protein
MNQQLMCREREVNEELQSTWDMLLRIEALHYVELSYWIEWNLPKERRKFQSWTKLQDNSGQGQGHIILEASKTTQDMQISGEGCNKKSWALARMH